MSKIQIFVVTGHSGSGKDTLTMGIPPLCFSSRGYDDTVYNILRIVPITTRKIRPGEINCNNYDFLNINNIDDIENYYNNIKKMFLDEIPHDAIDVDFYEARKYNVIDDNGDTKVDIYANYIGTLLPDRKYIMIGQLPSYLKLFHHVIKNNLLDKIDVKMIYLHANVSTRVDRLLKREGLKTKPNFEEVQRRVASDESNIPSSDYIRAILHEVIKYTDKNNISDYIDQIIDNINILDTSFGDVTDNVRKLYDIIKKG